MIYVSPVVITCLLSYAGGCRCLRGPQRYRHAGNLADIRRADGRCAAQYDDGGHRMAFTTRADGGVGAALGVNGAIFQSLMRNPLGSPDVMGFNTGAWAACWWRWCAVWSGT